MNSAIAGASVGATERAMLICASWNPADVPPEVSMRPLRRGRDPFHVVGLCGQESSLVRLLDVHARDQPGADRVDVLGRQPALLLPHRLVRENGHP